MAHVAVLCRHVFSRIFFIFIFTFFTVELVYSNKALIYLDSVHFGVGQGTVATHGFQMS